MLDDLYLKLLEMLIKTFNKYRVLRSFAKLLYYFYIMRYNPSSDYDYLYHYVTKIGIYLNYKNYHIIYFIQCIY